MQCVTFEWVTEEQWRIPIWMKVTSSTVSGTAQHDCYEWEWTYMEYEAMPNNELERGPMSLIRTHTMKKYINCIHLLAFARAFNCISQFFTWVLMKTLGFSWKLQEKAGNWTSSYHFCQTTIHRVKKDISCSISLLSVFLLYRILWL